MTSLLENLVMIGNGSKILILFLKRPVSARNGNRNNTSSSI